MLACIYFLCHASGMPKTEKDYAKEFARKGGYARAQSLTAEEQSKIGRKAARARWKKTKNARKGGSSGR